MTSVTVRHATFTGYIQDKCRCAECKAAWDEYQRQWRSARLADPTAKHNRVMYLSGCRCDECRAANAAYNLKRKAQVRASGVPIPHGTVDGYGSFGCRCDDCTSAKRAATRDHYLRNQLAFLEKCNRRRAAKAKDCRTVTTRDLRRLLARHDNACAYCGSSDHIELDHVIPLARGGRHAIGNLLPACRLCNRRKRTSLLIEWTGRPRGEEAAA